MTADAVVVVSSAESSDDDEEPFEQADAPSTSAIAVNATASFRLRRRRVMTGMRGSRWMRGGPVPIRFGADRGRECLTVPSGV